MKIEKENALTNWGSEWKRRDWPDHNERWDQFRRIRYRDHRLARRNPAALVRTLAERKWLWWIGSNILRCYTWNNASVSRRFLLLLQTKEGTVLVTRDATTLTSRVYCLKINVSRVKESTEKHKIKQINTCSKNNYGFEDFLFIYLMFGCYFDILDILLSMSLVRLVMKNYYNSLVNTFRLILWCWFGS